MSEVIAAFELENLRGEQVVFPGTSDALVCFIKEDCPTCKEVMPVLVAMHKAFAGAIDIQIIGQTLDGNKALDKTFAPGFSILDDSALKVSFAADVETVPTLFKTDVSGAVTDTLIGFVRDEWQDLLQRTSTEYTCAEVDVDWLSLPQWRPGCGSLSVDPSNADRLRAEAENSPIRARKIVIGSQDDEFEFMFDQGFSDGLPVIPPTPERVLRMLEGTRRDAQEIVGVMAPNLGEVTIEKIAINAVMAGCKPQYMPVVIAAVEAISTDDFNVHGVMATTMGASPVIVVNGPIRHQIGMNMGMGALGQGNRANATIGRAVRLVIRNVGGAKPGETERSVLGNPMKFTMCFAEWEERNPWQPLHVERGFDASDSVVSVFTMTSGPSLIVDQDSRSADALAGTIGQTLEGIYNPKAHFATNCLLVVVPEHVDTLMRDNYSKADLRRRIQETSSRPTHELVGNDVSGAGIKPVAAAGMSEEALNRMMPKFRTEDDIHIVVAGGEAGKFSAAFHGWVTGSIGSIPVSRKIDI
jgi:thiol-disulfide isomerase/thioredoxin